MRDSVEEAATQSFRSRLELLPSRVIRALEIGSGDGLEEDRLQKRSLVLTAVMITVLAIAWVVTYALLGLYVPAAIPFAYQVISVASLLYLARTGRWTVFRISQLSLMLALPALLQWSLGGFVASSGVILWSLTAPLGALVFSSRPLTWFLGYLGFLLASGLLEPFLVPAPVPLAVRLTFFVLNVGGVSTVVYFLLRYFMRGLASERERSEMLLLNVLPAPIARRLKTGERPLADRVEEVAVLFADLVGFAPIAERLEARELVAMLDEIFSGFDAMAERRGLEKIKTVGDAYMVVGGLPEPDPEAADSLAELALEMLERISTHATSWGEPLTLRIGIDIGPVVAGVIGQNKFTYDLWGDTVNTASRMESHGVPGRIQVTPRAYQRLRERYDFVPRQPIQVKGKGEMTPFLLVGRRN